MDAEDPYAGLSLSDRLELLTFEARHAGFPESLIQATTPDLWESAALLTDRVVSLLFRRPGSRFIATDRILPPEHFDFRGEAPRPDSLPEGQSQPR
jgi:hypothetical protein